ncbi:MAG: ArnT family glycosyltransferase [Chthoniobacterales bacterium]
MDRRPIQNSISSARGLRWAWTLVVACGLLLGYYLYETYGAPRHRQYQLDFGTAKWIEPADSPAPIAYFRKEVSLTTLPSEAWIEVAASDNFELIVNGRTVGTLNSVKVYEAGIYDIKSALKEGRNVIAVSISRTSFPGVAQLLLRGRIAEPGNIVTQLLSDESWRVTNNTGIVPGNQEWTSPRISDQTWPTARLSSLNEKKVPLRWVDNNPLLLQLPQVGSWIMAEDAPSVATFSTTVQADRPKQETWIQVASSGDLDLIVNGHILTTATASSPGGKALPRLARAEATPPEFDKKGRIPDARLTPKDQPDRASFDPVELAAYDISYWMERGPNLIVAAVRNENSPASFFCNGFVVAGGKIERFSTSSKWQVGDPSAAAQAKRKHAVEIGPDGVAPWGYLPQEKARPLDYSGFANIFKSWVFVGSTTLVIIALWLISAAIVSNWRREPLVASMSRDALFHGPVIMSLLLLVLPNYDPRFPDEWSFQPKIIVGAFAFLILIRLLHLLVDRWTPATQRARVESLSHAANWEARKQRARETISRTFRLPQLFEIPFDQLWPYLVLILIMFLGLGLRYHNLGYMSFDHDEMGQVAKSKGVLDLGFPYTWAAGQIRWTTTYEAVPYPLALFGFLFGYSEWSMRLPACLMGTLCIGVIGLMTRRLFDWRVGLFAAFVYACLPLNIRWAQNAFYLSQCQFLSMLTFWFFYEAIHTRPLRLNFLTGATVTFCLTYLSWEGTGFMLPALFLALLLVRWGEWWWLKEFHLYRCLFFMGAVVVAQYCSRMIAGSPYLQVGSGLSSLTGPSLFFMTAGYQPMFYVDKLLLSENHVFFTLLIVIGLPFCWKNLGFRYVFVLLATLFTLHSNFLAALSPRYCYYFQPLVLIGGVAASFLLYDRILAMSRHAGGSLISRFAAHATGVALLILLFVQSNESVMKLYQLSSSGDTPQMMTRMNTYRYDYRGAANYVDAHARPGDVILPVIPHVFSYYTGLPGDYFLDTLFSSKVPYNQTLSEPRFSDKFSGLPVIRNLAELKDVINRSGRAWIILAPYGSTEKLNSPAVLEYLRSTGKEDFESYRAKVMLIQGAQPATTVAQVPQSAE